VGSQGGGKWLAPEIAAQRLCIGVADLPDIGRPWANGDVDQAQRCRPDWLRRARKAWAAARVDEQRQRKARTDAVRLRQRTFEYPQIDSAATEFAHDFARLNLLGFLYSALDASSAETYVVDCGFDVSTYAKRVEESNRERARRDVSLSGRDLQWARDHGFYREPGTLGDLLDAPTGNTRATFVSGAGLDAETFDDAWYDRWALESLGHAYVIADLVLRGEVVMLENIAGVALSDADPSDIRELLDGVAVDVLALACQALSEWTEIDCPMLDPESLVDMDAPVSALPAMLLAVRRSWGQTELLAVAIAGLDVDGRADG